MAWLNSLRDQLPLLLVLSPLIGFLVTLAAARSERDLVRPLAISNSFCTLLILAGVVWQFELESSDVRVALRLAEVQDADKNQAVATLELAHDQLDKKRAERIRQQFFSVDGINLWPMIVLIVLTGIVVWPGASFTSRGGIADSESVPGTTGFRSVRHDGESPPSIPRQSKLQVRGDEVTRREGLATADLFVPLVFLFESLSIATMASSDLKVFLLASGTAAVVMSAMIGTLGGSDRRNLAERFLFAQIAGGALVMLGFAMLIVSVPWMKIEDSTSFPTISSNLGTLVYESQKWASRNQLAYQYQGEAFPWMLLALSVGFAIQLGLFPFHSWLISVLSETRREIAVLCLAGTVSAAGISWYRFVVPLAPDLLVGFDRLILIPAMGGAAWGALRARVPYRTRRRVAFLFLGLSAVSLMGCYCFTMVGMCGAWLMQQQLTLVVCAVLVSGDWASVFDQQDDCVAPVKPFTPTAPRATLQTPLLVNPRMRHDEDTSSGQPTRFSIQTLLVLLCLPAIGLFASGCMIVSELLRDSLLLVATVFVVGVLVIRSLHSILSRHYLDETYVRSVVAEERVQRERRLRGSLIVIWLLAVVVNLFPSWMLHQCQPEFDRVFRRFERSTPK